MNNQPIYKEIIKNKHANYQYFIEKTIEAGIIFLGWEVKAIRSKKIEIKNGYITIKKNGNNEAYLYNTTITPIILSSHIKYDTLRIRKLLLQKNELHLLFEKTKKTRSTIIPLELYWKNNWIKIKIALATGKKKYDKREKIKKREWILDKHHILT